MTMKELVEAVSTKSNVEANVVKKVLTAAIAALQTDIAKEAKVKVQGLGTFVRRTSKKDPEKSRITFKPAGPKDPEKVKARKAAKAKAAAS
jgi:nucleoid DNA-binding protein